MTAQPESIVSTQPTCYFYRCNSIPTSISFIQVMYSGSRAEYNYIYTCETHKDNIKNEQR